MKVKLRRNFWALKQYKGQVHKDKRVLKELQLFKEFKEEIKELKNKNQ